MPFQSRASSLRSPTVSVKLVILVVLVAIFAVLVAIFPVLVAILVVLVSTSSLVAFSCEPLTASLLESETAPSATSVITLAVGLLVP